MDVLLVRRYVFKRMNSDMTNGRSVYIHYTDPIYVRGIRVMIDNKDHDDLLQIIYVSFFCKYRYICGVSQDLFLFRVYLVSNSYFYYYIVFLVCAKYLTSCRCCVTRFSQLMSSTEVRKRSTSARSFTSG